MISIYSFPGVTEICALLAFSNLLRLINSLDLLPGPSGNYHISGLDSIQLILFGLILDTLTMPRITILLMYSPIRRIGRLIRSITDTHITQDSIANPCQPALIDAALWGTCMWVMSGDDGLGVWLRVAID